LKARDTKKNIDDVKHELEHIFMIRKGSKPKPVHLYKINQEITKLKAAPPKYIDGVFLDDEKKEFKLLT